jgi:hypothetical protein
MKYDKIYDDLIERARGRLIEGYVEKHHIVPKCMGGSDDASNLVPLTPEEHYIAHQLLVKIHPTHYGLLNAAIAMTRQGTYVIRSKNKMYGWLKRKLYDHRIEKECKCCGKVFGKENSPCHTKRLVYCSRECHVKDRQPEVGIMHCKHCDKELTLSKTDKGKSSRQFCNSSCYIAYRAQHYRKTMNCIACDKEVTVSKWKQSTFKFCCRKCKDTYNRKN